MNYYFFFSFYSDYLKKKGEVNILMMKIIRIMKEERRLCKIIVTEKIKKKYF